MEKLDVVVYKVRPASHSGQVCDRTGKVLREFQNTDERTQPAAFSWGEPGPGAYALAHSILSDRLGFSPSRQVAIDFAFKVIATLDPSISFELDSEIVDSFIDAQGGPPACKDEWEDEWVEHPETLTIETEFVSVEDVISQAGASEGALDEPQTTAHVAAALTGGIIASKGSQVTALAGSTIVVENGVIIVIGDKKFVVKSGKIEEII